MATYALNTVSEARRGNSHSSGTLGYAYSILKNLVVGKVAV